MTGIKRSIAVLITAAAILTVAACKTTVVDRDIPMPMQDHHDDHSDDRQPPAPDHR